MIKKSSRASKRVTRITPSEAKQALKHHFLEDREYLWAWHCNIAMAAYDSGCDHKTANEIAARIMSALFSIDTKNHPYYYTEDTP